MKQLPLLQGLGYFIPPRILDNQELSGLVETSDEWITTRTGIHERRVLEEGLGGSHMALRAAEKALESAGLAARDLTHILYATCTPDMSCPPSASILAGKLGIADIFTLDFNVACSGFIYGLSLVRGLLLAEPGARILLLASEVMTSRVNWQDRSTCVLFGDGSGAAVFSNEAPGRARLLDVLVSSNGSLNSLLEIRAGGSAHPYALGDTVGPDYFTSMAGREVYKHAVRNMTAISRDILERNKLEIQDIDLFIPHQANLRIIEAVGSKLGFDMVKVFLNVQIRGNTSAASIPLALAEAWEEGRIEPGMKALLTTFGAGFTWGAALLGF